ncbi:photosystem II reaction center protein Ycf12/Psb30 [Myxosarcina sp. GI1]|nr:photosystem II reaction center protein Ycf12 [Myxosarcina sp. GI1]
MDFITNLFSPFGNLDFNLIFQLICVALVMLSGPIVIFLLSLRGGDM